MRSH
jgi:hypothetical protein